MAVPKPKAKKVAKQSEREMQAIEDAVDKAGEEFDEEQETEDLVEDVGIQINGDEIQAAVRKMMKLSLFEPPENFWLNTGSPELNSVFGSRKLGIPYGKVIEVAGPEHCGKTLIANVMMGMAQRDGAAAGYIDLEESRDANWATKLGVNWEAVTKIYPELVKQKSGPPMLLSAEQICNQAEQAMYLLHKAGARKQFWFLDSIAMLIPATQMEAGLTGINMRTKLARADFLATLMPRWAGLAANYNALMLVSNQLRAKIGSFVMGDPDETTGGRALRHVASIRVRGRRLKGGRLKQGTAIVGLAGVFRNTKNKSGGGSVEGCEAAFKVRWDRPKASVKFMPVAELKAEMGEEK
jgi:RecA/RadA recombinase